MSLPIITVDNLSKSYRLGETLNPMRTFQDVLTQGIASPWRRVRSMARAQALTPPPDNTFWALKGVSFEVHRGEVVGIIGKNGAGKSTLFKIISRITEPTSGLARLRGRVASLLEVGTGFHPELTGRENVYLNGAILGMKRAEIARKFDEIVSFAAVEKFLDTPVKFYSSGMFVRLAFAVAAHLDPEILIVDEVLAVGDAEFQKKCIGRMKEVSRGEGRTVLFVSHSLGTVQSLCDRCILLRAGEVAAIGPTYEVLADYQSSSVAGTLPAISTTARRGQGAVQIVSGKLTDATGATASFLRCGADARIAIEYRSAKTTQLRGCRLSIAFADLLGHELFICSSELTNPELTSLPPTGALTCCIRRLPLTAGRYQLSLYLECDGVVQDDLQHAAEIEVVNGDFYGTGRNCPPGWEGRGILSDYRWELSH
jgi:lipopolysaccharide transport system ATP-binding protein